MSTSYKKWENRIQKCLDHAFYDNIINTVTYRKKLYNFKIGENFISNNNMIVKIGFASYGGDITVCDKDNGIEISYISLHFIYKEYLFGKIKKLYFVEIHRLRTKKEYRNKGIATYLMCLALLLADTLNIKEVTVNNKCSYREYYSLFRYGKEKYSITEW